MGRWGGQGSVIHRLGFPHQILRFTDVLDNTFTLWPRLPPRDDQDTPEGSDMESVRIRLGSQQAR